jgi:cysteinyl-tRNA synthetase
MLPARRRAPGRGRAGLGRTAKPTRPPTSRSSAAGTRFEAAIDDDLNVSAALAALFDLVRELNRRIADRTLSTADAERAIAFLYRLDTVLGILPDATEDLPPGAEALLAARLDARAGRDWAASDRLRDELLALGVAVEDTRDGQRWRRLEAVR